MRRFFLLLVTNIVRYRRGDMRTVIVCLLVSSFFWLAQRFGREYVTALKVPLHLELDKNISVSGQLPESLVLKLKGNGWMIFFQNLSFKFTPLKVVVEMDSMLSFQNHWESIIKNAVSDRLYEVEMIGAELNKSDFRLSKVAMKEIHLELDLSKVTVSNGCFISQHSIRPATINLKGGQSGLTQIPDTIFIPLELEMLEKTFTKQFTLDKLDKVEGVNEPVSVFVRLEVECN